MEPNKRIDVAMLQAEIEQHAAQAADDPPFYQLQLRRHRPLLAATVHIDPNPPLIGRTMYERIWVIINRSVRRVARLGIEPAVAAQNDFNIGIQRSLEGLIGRDAALQAEVSRLRARRRHDRG